MCMSHWPELTANISNEKKTCLYQFQNSELSHSLMVILKVSCNARKLMFNLRADIYPSSLNDEIFQFVMNIGCKANFSFKI